MLHYNEAMQVCVHQPQGVLGSMGQISIVSKFSLCVCRGWQPNITLKGVSWGGGGGGRGGYPEISPTWP